MRMNNRRVSSGEGKSMQTVLLVEDSRFLRISTERTLSRAGYRVVSAADGEEALQAVNNQHPDVVLLDMMLPKLSGPEVLHAIKNDSATAAIPVIVLSGLSRKNEEKLISAGAAAFVEKGSILDTPRSLLSVVARVLGATREDSPPPEMPGPLVSTAMAASSAGQLATAGGTL
jgi:CheY-like chemotaxis protein